VNSTHNTGRVWLVGAGPGDPDLLTVRAARVIADADVLLVDALVDDRVLALAKPGARVLDVGKIPRGPSVAQDDTCAMLADEARKGLRVVRLKGGDPFVFGRGGEEAMYLGARGIPVEIVPGLSSAIAVPTLAGIPLTHRGWSTSFTVLSGMKAPSTDVDVEAQWVAAAKTGGTLVFLMAIGTLSRVVARVKDGGLREHTPCAVIQNGSTPKERVLITDLAHLVADVKSAGITSPAVVVIGDVVALRDAIQVARAGFARVNVDGANATAVDVAEGTGGARVQL
jgi:uroporphyrin-III C-methyltransferase